MTYWHAPPGYRRHFSFFFSPFRAQEKSEALLALSRGLARKRRIGAPRVSWKYRLRLILAWRFLAKDRQGCTSLASVNHTSRDMWSRDAWLSPLRTRCLLLPLVTSCTP